MLECEHELKGHGKTSVALIVPVHNQESLLLKFLDSIKRQTVLPDVIVVDNGSDRPLVTTLGGREEVAVVLRLRRNFGSSGGFYAGMYYAMKKKYDIVVLADVDAIPLSPDLFQREIDALETNVADYVLPVNPLFEACGLVRFYEKTGLAPAHFLAVTVGLLRKAGLYDPCLYFGLDDFDLCLRLRKHGRFRVMHGSYYIHPLQGRCMRGLAALMAYRNNFIFGLRKSNRLSGIARVLHENLSLWLRSSVCHRSMMRETILGLRIFVGDVRGGIEHTSPQDLLMFPERFRCQPLMFNQASTEGSATTTRLESDLLEMHETPVLIPIKRIFANVKQVYLTSWIKFAVANLNPWIHKIFQIDFDPTQGQVLLYEFDSPPKDKALYWLNLIVNLPFFIAVIPILVMKGLLFKDHDPRMHAV
jgi:GT2 family glycosyltransferase